MTREDRDALPDENRKTLMKIQRLQKEFHQNAKELDRPYSPRRKMKKGERFGFNWYPIIGILVCIPILVLALYFYIFYFAMRWNREPGAGLYEGLSIAMVFLSIVVFIALQIIGSRRNNAEVERFNASIDREIQDREKKVRELKERNVEIAREIEELQKKIQEDS